ncbi:MAG: glycosyltransferase family 2 protein [Anaerolineae bacterium]|nr:glycosyltransferase family 2 protein [Anaerolineae bacterium]
MTEPDVQTSLDDSVPMCSVVVPVYNSERMLQELHQRLVAVLETLGHPFEIVFVEDCGCDDAWRVLCELAASDARVTALQLMRNSGQGSATLAGMARARGTWIITLDDDLQHPPEELPTLLHALDEDANLDIVIGVPASKKHSLVRRVGSNFINHVNSWFLGKPLNLRFTGFRAMRRQVAEALLCMHVPYPALGPMILSVTRRIANVTVHHDRRKQGRSGYTVSRIVKQTLSNFIGYSMLPLRLLAGIGAAGIVFSLSVGTYFLCRYLVIGISVEGWMTLLLILLGLSGFNFFAFAVLGEYVLRIAQVSANTSQWVVRDIAHGSFSNCVVVQKERETDYVSR